MWAFPLNSEKLRAILCSSTLMLLADVAGIKEHGEKKVFPLMKKDKKLQVCMECLTIVHPAVKIDGDISMNCWWLWEVSEREIKRMHLNSCAMAFFCHVKCLHRIDGWFFVCAL